MPINLNNEALNRQQEVTIFKKIIVFFIICIFSFTALAEKNIFTDESFRKKEFNLISKDLVAAFAHTINSGGSSLGSVWGFEAGIIAGVLSSKNLEKIAEDISGEKQDNLKYLPYAGLVGGLALPFGIGFELSIVPNINLEDGSFSNNSTALRWSVTDFIPIIGTLSPLKIAVKAALGKTKVNYTSSVTLGSKETADFEIKNTEFGIVAGFNLFLIEPYLGVSNVKSQTSLLASTDIKIPGIVTEQTLKSDLSGTRTVLGLLFKLPLFRIGFEWSNLQDSNRYTGKLSLKI